MSATAPRRVEASINSQTKLRIQPKIVSTITKESKNAYYFSHSSYTVISHLIVSHAATDLSPKDTFPNACETRKALFVEPSLLSTDMLHRSAVSKVLLCRLVLHLRLE